MTYGNLARPYPVELEQARMEIEAKASLIGHLRTVNAELTEANRGLVERIIELERDLDKARAARDRYYGQAVNARQDRQGSSSAGETGLSGTSEPKQGNAATRPPQRQETA